MGDDPYESTRDGRQKPDDEEHSDGIEEDLGIRHLASHPRPRGQCQDELHQVGGEKDRYAVAWT
jgi:hypothetical protein